MRYNKADSVRLCAELAFFGVILKYNDEIERC